MRRDFRKCWKIFVIDFYSNNNPFIVFDQIFHAFLIKACFQNKNATSECLKNLTTGATLRNCFNRISESQALYSIGERVSHHEFFYRDALPKNFTQNSLFFFRNFFVVVDLQVYHENTPSLLFSEWFCETFGNSLHFTSLARSPLGKMITSLRKQSNTQ